MSVRPSQTRLCSAPHLPQTKLSIFPCSMICWDQRDFKKLQSRQCLHQLRASCEGHGCARSPDSEQYPPNPHLTGAKGTETGAGPSLVSFVMSAFKLHDLLTKSLVWKPRRYTQLLLPSPYSLSELGTKHCKAPWPLQPLLSNTATSHKHH